MVSPAAAQQPPGRTVAVISDGEARAEPDIAFLNAGVQADGATAREAMTAANRQMETVIAALQAVGIAREDIQTSGLNVFPVYENERPPTPAPADSGPREPTGFRASNSADVTIRDLTQVEAVLEALLNAGITNLGGLRFGVSDTGAMHAQALAEAVRAARPLAEASAQAAGLTLGAVETVEELSDFSGPTPVAQSAARGGAVETGTLTLRVRVRVTFQVA
jgi:uncharacterized protein YggE